ncbi:MAG TPA: hypothetical protein VEQ09_12270 [Aquabacterium sp.]|nr:hypothetical protein [Aquabacterium sp.]
MRVRHQLVAIFVVVVVALGGAACGSSKKSSAPPAAPATAASPSVNDAACASTDRKSFAKARFVANAGLAAGAFHRYIYKPLKAGGFKQGADKRKRTFVKAAVAAVFVVNRLNAAKEDARGDPTLCRYAASLSQGFENLKNKLHGGTATPADVDSGENGFTALRQQAGRDGAGFSDQNVPVPGAS